MKKLLLFLFFTIFIFGRENPFIPLVTNKNNNLIKKQEFKNKTIHLPNDSRILKSVIFKYQTLTGTIKELEIPINESIDWHNPIKISSLKKIETRKKINISFLNFYIKKHTILIQTKDKLLRKFLLVKPFRYVIDFKADKNFLTYSKKINSFIKEIVLGNHNGFYRIVLYLDGTYKTTIKNTNKGYLIEFK